MKKLRVLIANRGEIAVRVIRTCQVLGIETVLTTSEADTTSLAAQLADQTVVIGPARAEESYLNVRAVISAAVSSGADVLHPGYGFLAESPALVEACGRSDIIFVGPTAEQMRAMGDNIEARRRAESAGVPVLPAPEKIASVDDAARIASIIGYPLRIKAAEGGGGRRTRVATDPSELQNVYMAASAEALSSVADPSLCLERYVPNARHVAVQVLGDNHGNVIHLGERECVLQLRQQDIVEAPAIGIDGGLRGAICAAAVRLAQTVDHRGAGTIEFLVDTAAHHFYFLKMHTQLQIEHPVSEMITGIDLVEEQFRIAADEVLRFNQDDVVFRGHAIQCQIMAEVAEEGFPQDAGRITHWAPPIGPNIRIDTHCYDGYDLPAYYDSLIAKLVVIGLTRSEARERMSRALARFGSGSLATTTPFLRFVIDGNDFKDDSVSPQLIDEQLVTAFRESLAWDRLILAGEGD